MLSTRAHTYKQLTAPYPLHTHAGQVRNKTEVLTGTSVSFWGQAKYNLIGKE